jgi:hypothetical protein
MLGLLLRIMNKLKDVLMRETELITQSDSKLLSEFLWHLNGNSDNNLESSCIIY